MPLLMSLLGGLLTIVGSVVGRALLALGMGFVTYQGFDVGIGWLLTQIKANVSALPLQVGQFLAFIWLDKAIGLVFSAYSAAALIRMAGSSKLTKLVTKG
jgi:hypothetical protein